MILSDDASGDRAGPATLVDTALAFVLTTLSLLIGAALVLVLVFVAGSVWTVVEIVGGWF